MRKKLWFKLTLCTLILLGSIFLPKRSDGEAEGKGTCCVTCGGVTVCSTSVDMDCGSCDGGGNGRLN